MLQKKHIFGQLGLSEWYSVLILFLDLHFTRADAQEAPGAERDDTNWRGRFSHPPAFNSRNTLMYKLQIQKKTLQIHIVTYTYINTLMYKLQIQKNITNTHSNRYIYKFEGALPPPTLSTLDIRVIHICTNYKYKKRHYKYTY